MPAAEASASVPSRASAAACISAGEGEGRGAIRGPRASVQPRGVPSGGGGPCERRGAAGAPSAEGGGGAHGVHSSRRQGVRRASMRRGAPSQAVGASRPSAGAGRPTIAAPSSSRAPSSLPSTSMPNAVANGRPSGCVARTAAWPGATSASGGSVTAGTIMRSSAGAREPARERMHITMPSKDARSRTPSDDAVPGRIVGNSLATSHTTGGGHASSTQATTGTRSGTRLSGGVVGTRLSGGVVDVIGVQEGEGEAGYNVSSVSENALGKPKKRSRKTEKLLGNPRILFLLFRKFVLAFPKKRSRKTEKILVFSGKKVLENQENNKLVHNM